VLNVPPDALALQATVPDGELGEPVFVSTIVAVTETVPPAEVVEGVNVTVVLVVLKFMLILSVPLECACVASPLYNAVTVIDPEAGSVVGGV